MGRTLRSLLLVLLLVIGVMCLVGCFDSKKRLCSDPSVIDLAQKVFMRVEFPLATASPQEAFRKFEVVDAKEINGELHCYAVFEYATGYAGAFEYTVEKVGEDYVIVRYYQVVPRM